MPDIVSFNAQKLIIEVRSSETLTQEEWLACLNEIRRYRDREGATRVLVDASCCKEAPSVQDIYTTVEEHLPRKMKYALVVGPEQHIAKDARFLETVSINRGIELKLFRDSVEACEWLTA